MIYCWFNEVFLCYWGYDIYRLVEYLTNIFLLLDCFGYCKPIKCSDNRLFIVCGSVVDIDNTSESDVQLLPNRYTDSVESLHSCSIGIEDVLKRG